MEEHLVNVLLKSLKSLPIVGLTAWHKRLGKVIKGPDIFGSDVCCLHTFPVEGYIVI